MSGSTIKAVEHLKKCEAADLDNTTLRHLRNDMLAEVKKLAEIRAELTTDEQRKSWDDVFAGDTPQLEALIGQVEAVLEGRA